jgi:dihydrofolate reductase
MSRKLIVYISCSFDGFIAKPNDDLSFLELVQKDGEDYGYSDFIETIDTVIIGRKTYDWVMSHVDKFPNSHKETYVITKLKKENNGKIVFYNDSLTQLVLKLKKEMGKHIFCDGGAQIVNELYRTNLIDEVILSVVPIIVGNGTKLFEQGIPEKCLKLISSKTFDTGLVQLHYQLI